MFILNEVIFFFTFQDSQELETIYEVSDNSEANMYNSKDNSDNIEGNIDNNEGNIDSIENNIDKNESISNLKNLNPQPSTFSSSSKRLNMSTSVPTPKRKKITQVAALVNETRSIKDYLKNIPEYENDTPDENVHDIFGKFASSQLKQ